MGQSYNIFKRGFDILFAIGLLVVSSPLLLFAMILIKLEDGGKVLFKQKRTGKDGKLFTIYKFRTMKENHKIASFQEAEFIEGIPDDFIYKNVAQDNPAVTKVGHWLRKYSIDELPQAWNILEGTMSAVGPRPEIPEITKHYTKEQCLRLQAKPGLTGLAQVSGRSRLTNGEKINYDIEYVHSASMKVDLKIIWKTVLQVIVGKDAV